jgi:hypothetical protein
VELAGIHPKVQVLVLTKKKGGHVVENQSKRQWRHKMTLGLHFRFREMNEYLNG